MSTQQHAINLAMGRLFRLMSRPYQPGDDETYTAVRSFILDRCEPAPEHAPNWVRDRLHGACGQ